MNKIRIGILLLICVICGLLNLGAKSCINLSNNKTKSGSSNDNAFMINAPSNLTATVVSLSQINLSWQGNSNNEDGFEIQRRIDYEIINRYNMTKKGEAE